MKVTRNENLISIGAALKFLGVSRPTLLLRESRGKIKPFRDENGSRFYAQEDLEKLKRDMMPRQNRKVETRRGRALNAGKENNGNAE